MAPVQKIRVIRSSGVDTTRFRPRQAGITRPTTARIARGDGSYGRRASASSLRRRESCRERGSKMEFLLAGMPDPGNPTLDSSWQMSRSG